MRISPVIALAAASFGLVACSINTAPPAARSPDVVAVQPATAPTVVTTQPAPSTVFVRP